AIKLHPLVCHAFNADFDGDQMAVHVPLSIEAQAEARILMLASNNILRLSDGKPIVSPTQDMVIGAYYLTQVKPKAKGEGRWFISPEEARMAYAIGDIELQAEVNVRITKEIDNKVYQKIIKTTPGKIIFNDAIPQDLGFRTRTKPEDLLDFEIDFHVSKKELSQIVESCFKLKGATVVSKVLDKIKTLGFKYSTIGAITTSIFDMQIPGSKKEILKKAEKQVIDIEKNFKRGIITDEERYNEVVDIWKTATDEVEKDLETNFKRFDKMNPIWMMANSGARGSMQQIKQLSGMRGLMNDPTGKIIEIPVRASFREGLSVLEYFISSHGARKGGADTALKTADSGYLTRRLVDVSQDVIIRELDCGDNKGFVIKDLYDLNGRLVEGIAERLEGRYTIDAVHHPKTGEVIVEADTLITEDSAKSIQQAHVKQVKIRNILSCKTKVGVCAKCYGANMSSSNIVKLGEAVGVIAAQSIGEPGTQLTMRTFHTGGVASAADITQGLPRVVELFEARKPKGEAQIAEISGAVTINEENKQKKVIIKTNEGDSKEYKIPYGVKLIVKNGDLVEAGDPLYLGSVDPDAILKTKGVSGVQESMIREVQSAYRSNGVHINDKHIEVIVRQMLRKVKVSNPNDTTLLMNELVDRNRLDEENEKVLETGGLPATATRVLLGISKAALATESFLSAASFQETAKVLTDAAIKSKVDNLLGLKENVIIGKLIPAGTGMKIYRDVELEVVGRQEEQRKTMLEKETMDYDDMDNDDNIDKVE
ncbi:MAG: DNA-directed RNA polymerase subunit beta', partial [Bacillota bacterium]